MLQSEIDENLRVHIWHPDLVRIPEGPRRIHDHRFDITSYVIVGEVGDVRYRVVIGESAKPTPGWTETQCWEIKHAKTQVQARVNVVPIRKGDPVSAAEFAALLQAGARLGCSTATDAELLGRALFATIASASMRAGAVYEIPRRVFHTTVVSKLAVTFVQRSNFDDKLARVLGDAGDGKSAIQKTNHDELHHILKLAARALKDA